MDRELVLAPQSANFSDWLLEVGTCWLQLWLAGTYVFLQWLGMLPFFHPEQVSTNVTRALYQYWCSLVSLWAAPPIKAITCRMNRFSLQTFAHMSIQMSPLNGPVAWWLIGPFGQQPRSGRWPMVPPSRHFVISNDAPIGELTFCLTRQIHVKLARPI